MVFLTNFAGFTMKPILKAVAMDQAFIVPRFPFCYGMCVTIKYWVETKPTYGQRLVTQMWDATTNQWSKPKREGYHSIVLLTEVEEIDNYYTAGHVQVQYLNLKESTHDTITKFRAANLHYLSFEQLNWIDMEIMAIEARNPEQYRSYAV